MLGFSSRHAFQAATPFLRTCSSFAMRAPRIVVLRPTIAHSVPASPRREGLSVSALAVYLAHMLHRPLQFRPRVEFTYFPLSTSRTGKGVSKKGALKAARQNLLRILDMWHLLLDKDGRCQQRHRHDPGSTGEAVPRVRPGRYHNRAEVRRHWARPCHHPQASAHDGGRRDRDERAGQRFSIHRATAGALNAMNLPRRRFLHLVAGAAALPAVSRIASAQAYPSRPVRIIVGFAPSGATDIMARLIGQWLSERLGQQFIVENRPGAASNIATEAVARSAPDGYTLLLVTAINAWNATLYGNLKFNFMRDIAPIASIARASFV